MSKHLRVVALNFSHYKSENQHLNYDVGRKLMTHQYIGYRG